MFDWFVTNREWVFQGIGVTVIGGASAFLWKMFTGGGKRTTETPATTEKSTGPHVVVNVNPTIAPVITNTTTISQNNSAGSGEHVVLDSHPNVVGSTVRSLGNSAHPAELLPWKIRKTIEASPALQQKLVAERYVGQLVEWEGQLSSVTDNKDSVTIYMMAANEKDTRLSEHVRLKVSLDENMWLQLAHSGDKMKARGRISKVDDLMIYLEEASAWRVD